MNATKRCLLNTYYYATAPWRMIAGRVRCARQNEPVQIAFYHRVADEVHNPWTISRQGFVEQLDLLTQRFDLVSLEEAQRRIASGRNHRPTAAITFDDGYADNMDFAVPLLLERRIPFTYFVTTGNVLSGEPFPHDLQRHEPLKPNTRDEIRALADAGVEIGAHTRTHADLGRVDHVQLEDEIGGSKNDLERMTGRDVRYFAFPFGQPANMTAAGFETVRQAGFAGVCSAYGGYNFPGGDSFHLERFHADPEMIRFKQWLSVDSVKQFRSPTFDLSFDVVDQSTEQALYATGEGV